MGLEFCIARYRDVPGGLFHLLCRKCEAHMGRAVSRVLEGKHHHRVLHASRVFSICKADYLQILIYKASQVRTRILEKRDHLTCWSSSCECRTHTSDYTAVQDNIGCSKTFLESLNFSQVAGLFLGMVVLGFSVDRIGRKRGSISTAVIMLIGILILERWKSAMSTSLQVNVKV